MTDNVTTSPCSSWLGANFATSRVPLTCPRCSAQGVVDWSLLGRAINCHHCQCRFIVQRGGKVVSLDELPQVSFKCPRCRTAGSMAALLATDGAECQKCKLPLQLGPDNRVHSAAEAARLKKLVAAKRAASQGDRPQLLVGFLTRNDGAWSRSRIAAALIVLISTFSAIGWQSARYFDRSPTALAKRMVQKILAGDAAGAEAFIEDNAVQRVEFERWHLRHFSSLRNAFRPASDRMKINALVLDEQPTQQVLELELSSPATGTRKYKTYWQENEGRWVFDAFRTLAADTTPQSRVPAARQRAELPIRAGKIPHLVPSGP